MYVVKYRKQKKLKVNLIEKNAGYLETSDSMITGFLIAGARFFCN